MSNLRIFAEDGNYKTVPAEQLFHARKNWFIGWKCLAGTQSLYIDQEGAVFSANCKSIGVYGRRHAYGNIFREFRLETAPINCARRFCESEFDLAIPKYHRPKHRIVLDGGVEVPDIGEPIAIMGTEIKRVLWNLSLFELKPYAEWKQATHRLEHFCKGEAVQIILEDPPVQSREFFDFLKFLTEEKGHFVKVEGAYQVNPDFYNRSLSFADLCLKYEGEVSLFFKNLDKLSEEFKLLHQRNIHRKVEVQLNIKNPDYGLIRKRLLEDPYKDWLEAGFYSGQLIQPIKSIELSRPTVEVKPYIPVVPESVRTSISGVRILLFIPMRNCAGTIGQVIAGSNKDILDYMDEVLILDNDSTDDSMKVAGEAIKSIKDVKVILRKNEKNYGFGGSHKLAFQYAELNRMDYIFIVHGDNSGSPGDFIPVLRSGDFKNFDMILSGRMGLGSRRENYPFYRFLGNWILNFMASFVTLSRITDFSGGPVNLCRVQSFINKYENPVKRFDDRISFLQYALLYVNYRKGSTLFIPVHFREAGGKSLYTAATQFTRSILLLLNYLFAKKNLFK